MATRTVLDIGDGNRTDTVRVSDISRIGIVGYRVTVREMVGGFSSWRGGRKAALAAMRRTAARAVAGPTKTYLVRTFFDGGQQHATFLVEYVPTKASA